jgi:5-methylcytosine-specific restriction endonuclease McrA
MALERDEYECQSCGSSTSLQVHHIEDGDDHSVENLKTLCAECHQDLHIEERFGPDDA